MEQTLSPVNEFKGQGGSASTRYDELKKDRQLYEDRAKEAAKLTIPLIFRDPSDNATTPVTTPWQGLGARGLKVLTAKFLLAILPANSPFWRYLLTDAVLENLGDDTEGKTKLEEQLAVVERLVQDYIEMNAHRPKVAELLGQLLVAGNALLYVAPDGKLRVFRLTNFVVYRDPLGNWLEVLTHEKIARAALPESVQALLEDSVKSTTSVDVYTWVRREGDAYVVHQEVAGKIVPGSDGRYPLDACPWIPLRFYSVDGESYGRSYVEELMGDLVSLEIISKATVEASVSAARTVHGVKPGASVKKKALQDARNNDVIDGDLEGDVTTLRTDKGADFQFALAVAERIESRLNQAFLMNSAVQRNAERVTAEEVRFMAQELETVLAGAYSTLAAEFQLPYLKAILSNLERQGVMPRFPEGTVKPVIVTGLGALGRGQDLTKLQQFIGVMQPFGEQALSVINMDDYATRVATALGLDTRGLVKTPEQLQSEQMAQQMSQMDPAMMQQMVPPQ